ETYLTIRLLSVPFIIGTEALNNWYGGLGNTRIAMFVGVAVLVLNIWLNYALIEPRFGLPGYGVAGAAIASTISSGFGYLVIQSCLWLGVGHDTPRFSRGFS